MSRSWPLWHGTVLVIAILLAGCSTPAPVQEEPRGADLLPRSQTASYDSTLHHPNASGHGHFGAFYCTDENMVAKATYVIRSGHFSVQIKEFNGREVVNITTAGPAQEQVLEVFAPRTGGYHLAVKGSATREGDQEIPFDGTYDVKAYCLDSPF